MDDSLPNFVTSPHKDVTADQSLLGPAQGVEPGAELAATPSPLAPQTPQDVDAQRDRDVVMPFDVSAETFPVPTSLPPELEGDWLPGRPLIIAYVTWNTGNALPDAAEIEQCCVLPNAHIVAVATQENGPYVGTNAVHDAWLALVEQRCLRGEYARLHAASLWAAHHAVFARRRDVAPFVREVHSATTRTGSGGGAMGNKGGIGIAFTVSLRRSTALRVARGTSGAESETGLDAATQRLVGDDGEVVGPLSYSPRNSDAANGSYVVSETTPLMPAAAAIVAAAAAAGGGEARASAPHSTAAVAPEAAELRLLFVAAHLTAHQHNAERRNNDYLRIVRELRIGTAGLYASKYRHALASPIAASDPRRDATSEFDLAFFGGDLNYRIHGTKAAIEFIIKNHRQLRPALVANDQLTQEKRRGVVFNGFEEGDLHFRPTYKFHVHADGRITDDYDLSAREARMPAYCDRVLMRQGALWRGSTRQLLYTDVRGVTTSDHRPVVAMYRVETRLQRDSGVDEEPALPDFFESGDCCV